MLACRVLIGFVVDGVADVVGAVLREPPRSQTNGTVFGLDSCLMYPSYSCAICFLRRLTSRLFTANIEDKRTIHNSSANSVLMFGLTRKYIPKRTHAIPAFTPAIVLTVFFPTAVRGLFLMVLYNFVTATALTTRYYRCKIAAETSKQTRWCV
jgi:hypothetical protein